MPTKVGIQVFLMIVLSSYIHGTSAMPDAALALSGLRGELAGQMAGHVIAIR